ncbi:MAG: TIGR02757 family protein [Spirochaetota bacterium]
MSHPLPAHDPGIALYLGRILRRCNRLARLDRDPLALVRPFGELADRELAGLVASTLAFGQVDLIMRAVRQAMEPLGEHPAAALDALKDASIRKIWGAFQYRFMHGPDMVALLLAAKRARAEFGGLGAMFVHGDPGGKDIVDAVGEFSRRLRSLGGPLREGLLPDPARGSACKRLFLYLRWMVRHDAVDPGGWRGISRARLVIPIDVHMARVCSAQLGFIPSPAATLANALRATEAFRLYAPRDPVKYDFALTRPGIDPQEGDAAWGVGWGVACDVACSVAFGVEEACPGSA